MPEIPTVLPASSATSWQEGFRQYIQPRIASLRAPWSIAELGLSEEAYELLVAAFAQIRGLDWEILSYGKTEERDQARLFLVVVLAEYARRHTQGDRIWSCMKRLPMRECLRHRFFHANGQPSRDLRIAIESAAYRWKLRHVFNVPGHMAWFLTLFLQFGFPIPAAKKRLPFWLSGQICPVSVGYLLGGEMVSPTFVQAWQSLWAYRKRHMTEQKCQQVLANNPWVLSDWIPELMRLAKSRLDLVDHTDSEEGEEVEPLILGDPCLIWGPGEEPRFRCEILAAATFDLKGTGYEIRSQSFESVRILRQEDDSYYIWGDAYVEIPLGRASVQCTLTSLSGGAGDDDVATQSVALWDPHFPVSLYRRGDGVRMRDPEKPERLEDGCYAIYHGSFAIDPVPVRNWEHGSWWIAEVPACEFSDLALKQNGDRVWWPEVDEASDGINQRRPSATISAGGEVIQWNNRNRPPEVRFQINLDRGCELTWVRVGPEVVDFENAAPLLYRTSPFALRPEHAVYPLYVTVGFQSEGRAFRVTSRVDLKTYACFIESEGELSVYESSRALNIRNTGKFLFHILRPGPLPGMEARRDWIFEGTRVVRSMGKRGMSLTNLTGYGEALTMRHGLYNSDRKPIELISRVRDNGLVKSVRFNESRLVFSTCSPIELDEDHQLIVWMADHRVLQFDQSHLEPGEYPEIWECDLSPWQDEEGRNPPISAIGFFYRGDRLGNWFDHRIYYGITKIDNEDDAALCAEILRWFKAPIMDSEWLGAMRYLLKNFLGVVMPVWLESSKSPELDLAEIPVSENWLRVISSLGRSVSWKELTVADVSQIVEAVYLEFNPSKLEGSLPLALERLEGLNATLIAKIAHLYLSEMSNGELPGNAHSAKRSVLDRFEVGEEELNEFCHKLDVDAFFVQHMFERIVEGRDLNEAELRNRDLLLNHRLMRRKLAHLYLSKIRF